MTEIPKAPDFQSAQNAEPPPKQKRPDGLPDNFQIADDGSIQFEVRSGEKVEWKWLCSPLMVRAVASSPRDEDWSRLIEITIRKKGRADIIKTWVMPAEILGGDGIEARRACLSLGLHMQQTKEARAAFHRLLNHWRPSTHYTTTDRVGWMNADCKHFVLGNGDTLTANGIAEKVIYQDEHAAGLAAEIVGKGTLTDWKEHVARRCLSNPLLMTGVSLAFAGPLLELLNQEGGGLHYRGDHGKGKSTSMYVTSSVWGSRRFCQSWRTTDNGLEGLAAEANSTALILDEMGEFTNGDPGPIAYMLANGQGKTRANKLGKTRAKYAWKLLFLSSGEISLESKMAEYGKRIKAGQEIRLLDIEATGRRFGLFDDLHGEKDGASFAQAMNTAASTYYGAAGPEFIRRILNDKDRTKADAEAYKKAFAERAAEVMVEAGMSPTGQGQRGAKRLALIAAGGELATQYGLTGWPMGAAAEACLVAFRLWIQGGGAADHVEARQSIDNARDFVLKNSMGGFAKIITLADGHREVQAEKINNLLGYQDSDYFYITGRAWCEDAQKGCHPRTAARHLRDAGLLHPESKKSLKYRMPITAVKQRPWVYAVNKSIIDEGDE